MQAPRVNPIARLAGAFGQIRVVFAIIIASIAIFVGATTLPATISGLDQGDQEWVSALVATIVLVAASMLLQRNQVRHERLWLQREYTFNILKMAMDDPIYAQCWGPRVSPPDMDERLFYYTNLMIMVWSYAWEHGQIDGQQVRAYARAFFESEVAREYWKRFGALRARSRRPERAFYEILDEEYAKAVASGPPARPYEPSARPPETGRLPKVQLPARLRRAP